MKYVPFLVSDEDWSLHRKGYMDQQRHREKVKEAIRKNLSDVVSEEGIIMSNGKKTLKLPVRALKLYKFRFNHEKQTLVGQGEGNTQKGDALGRDNGKDTFTKGEGAGEEPGEDYYETDVTIDEMEEIVFSQLELPNLKNKKAPDLESKSIHFNDVRKSGSMGNIHKKKTILANLKRNSLKEKPHIGNFSPEDMCFKSWDEVVKYESNAVIIAMMDVSGSMGEYEKYIARSFYFWMSRFLKSNYESIKIIFVAHHTEAKEVTEEEFFTKGESGGTKCSSAYRLALDLIEQKYNPQDYNIYLFHFSDGDNLPSDNDQCIKLINQLLDNCNMFGYGEIGNPYYSSSLVSVYKKIKNPKFSCLSLKDKTQVHSALKAFFHQDSGGGAD
ncbi:hypothetical protein GGQ84_001529 [Desulfitispora alkaliphila]|uniref:sporulation protein YhbH n=1 Tax=Desulfitispora alkaliphila TaxID=622674 RepID=UPI003D1FCA21